MHFRVFRISEIIADVFHPPPARIIRTLFAPAIIVMNLAVDHRAACCTMRHARIRHANTHRHNNIKMRSGLLAHAATTVSLLAAEMPLSFQHSSRARPKTRARHEESSPTEVTAQRPGGANICPLSRRNESGRITCV